MESKPNIASARVIPVQNHINNRTGVKIVTHGERAQAMHMFDEVDAFDSGGEKERWTAAQVQPYAAWKWRTLTVS